jgi:chromosome segregation ATPase
MIDPRFKETLEFIEELDADGVPTVRAKIAIKIQAYAQDVDDLKKELAILESDIGELQATVDAQDIALHEQASRKNDLVTEAQDAAVQAAMSGAGGASARLRKQAQATRDRITEFTKYFEEDSTRLANSQIALNAKKQTVKDQRDTIVRRLNTMSSLADRAGVDFGTEMMEPPPQTKQTQRGASATRPGARVVRRRPRRVRVVRRRAS